MGIEARLHSLQVAANTLRGASFQFNLPENKGHLSIAVKAAGRQCPYDIPMKAAAFGNQQRVTG